MIKFGQIRDPETLGFAAIPGEKVQCFRVSYAAVPELVPVSRKAARRKSVYVGAPRPTERMSVAKKAKMRQTARMCRIRRGI